jgi:hypothetical protein
LICYPERVTDAEILAINDCWSFSNDGCTEFRYTMKEVGEKYKSKGVRSISSLIKKSGFFIVAPGFACLGCEHKSPVSSRTEFKRRIDFGKDRLCQDCDELRGKRIVEDSRRTLAAYKAEVFKPAAYLDALSVEELLALLVLFGGLKAQEQFLGGALEDIVITQVSAIDQRLLISLIDKKALIWIRDLPSEVSVANSAVYGSYSRLSYDNRSQYSSSYHQPGSLNLGVYLNFPVVDGVEISDVGSVFQQKLRLSSWPMDAAARLHQLIKDMQVAKLYNLAAKAGKEQRIPIANTQVLSSLLDHLAENYPPLKVNFTFNIKARDVAAYIHKERSESYIAKNYFAKFVANFIQRYEEKGWDLQKTWSLPPNVQPSPFEALFAQFFLNGHFDWSRLSVKEVVALWLENVRLSDEVIGVLVEGEGGK